MAKETGINLNPYTSLYKRYSDHTFIKLILSFFLIGISFRLLASDTFSFLRTPPSSPSLVQNGAESPQLPISNLSSSQAPFSAVGFKGNESLASRNVSDKCDIFTGDWVPDHSGPAYTNETCKVIEDPQNCMRNGRPDSGYLYWRWKPRDCDLPRFDPEQFLDTVRNKIWAFIGDSISRNHVQSLLCTLSQVEQAVEVYHDEEYRSKIWKFPSYNFTVSIIWAPLLLKAEIFEDPDGVSSSEIQLHLDTLNKKWTDQYKNFDYVVIAGGKWFLKTAIYHENNTITGCHYCPGKNLTELGFEYAYRKALQLVLKFITESDHKAFVLLRTTTPDHFENGEWFSGGTCNRTVPFREGEIELKDVDAVMREIEIEEYGKARATGDQNGVVLRLLDTTKLTMYRPDGHPGPYRQFHPFAKDKHAKVQNDCLHWCLPGPIDSWNDLVIEVVVNGEQYR